MDLGLVMRPVENTGIVAEIAGEIWRETSRLRRKVCKDVDEGWSMDRKNASKVDPEVVEVCERRG